MKQTFKFIGFGVIAVTMIYNLKISAKTNEEGATLAYVRNTAQADDEGSDRVEKKTRTTSVETVTIDKGGSNCTETRVVSTTECEGTGAVACTPESTSHTTSSTCN